MDGYTISRLAGVAGERAEPPQATRKQRLALSLAQP